MIDKEKVKQIVEKYNKRDQYQQLLELMESES